MLDLLDISLGATSISNPADAWGLSRPQVTFFRRAIFEFQVKCHLFAQPSADPWSNHGQSASPPIDPWHAGGAAAATTSGARPAGTASVESWLSRTQSPSSGSSAESAWLQNGSTGQPQLPSNGHHAGPSGAPSDAWMASNNPVDPWLNKPPVAADPWKSPNLNATHNNTTTHDALHMAPLLDSRPVDPWSAPGMGARPSPIGAQMSPNSDLDEFDVITNRLKHSTNNNNCNKTMAAR